VPPGEYAPPSQQVPALPPQPAPPEPAGHWHRYHYPVGIFLALYGLTGLLTVVIGWSGHHKEIADYLTRTAGIGTGAATPVLVGLHVIEALLVLVAVAGLLRRRDVWFLPVLLGWVAGFAVFCVLDVWAGTLGLLAEHAVYLAGFTVVLCVSYALGVKARVGGAPAPGGPDRRPGPVPLNLSRTQEFALSALNRWQRTGPAEHVRLPPDAAAEPAHHAPVPAGPAQAPPPRQAPPHAVPAPPDGAPAQPPPPRQAPEAPARPAAPAPAPPPARPAPLPPPRRFPVTPPDQRPPGS
jgi:hypothetical protein